MTPEILVLLHKAVEAHDQANDFLGCGDPLPFDMKAKAYMDAAEVLGFNTSRLKSWEQVRRIVLHDTTPAPPRESEG